MLPRSITMNKLHPWEPYRPNEQAPWNVRRVVHLHRRAGFAATWSEIQRDLADGPEASVARVLDGLARRDYFTSQAGYDTHASQLSTHAQLLGELGGGFEPLDLLRS